MATRDEQTGWLRKSVAVHLTEDVVVSVRGDDAITWFNGQVTNDVRAPSGDAAIYGLAATVKGRVISDVWALADEGGLTLLLPAAGCEAALSAFDEHIIMEDVELTRETDLCVITVQGPRAGELARPPGLRSYGCARLHAQGFDVLCTREDRERVVAQLAEAAQQLGGGAVDDAAYADGHVLLAVPRMGVDFGASTYPQEAGLKAHAISFNKGCYRGQEVIYMLENRGQLARRLVQLEGPAGLAPSPGDTLTDPDGKRLGEVTSCAVTEGEHPATYALGFVKRAAAELGTSVRAGACEMRVRHVVGVTDEPCPIVAH